MWDNLDHITESELEELKKSFYDEAHEIVEKLQDSLLQIEQHRDDSSEAWFYHTPGLKIVYPSTPEDAKGLLLSAFEDPNPVMFFEQKALYRGISGLVPDGYYTTPIGKARQVRIGSEASVITYGMGVRWAEALADVRDGSAEKLKDSLRFPLQRGCPRSTRAQQYSPWWLERGGPTRSHSEHGSETSQR